MEKMANLNLETNEIQISKENTDRYVTTFDSLDEANRIRFNIQMYFKPKTIVFVMKSICKDKGWDLFISNEFWSRPSNTHLENVKNFVNTCLE